MFTWEEYVPRTAEQQSLYPPANETRYGRGHCGPAAAQSHAPNSLYQAVCQQGGSIWQTVYKTVPAVTEATESYWDIVFIGIPIPVKRTKTTKTVRYNHYKRVYRCNGTVSDWELVDSTFAGDQDGGTVTKAFGIFPWASENQEMAASMAPSTITAKVRITPRVKDQDGQQLATKAREVNQLESIDSNVGNNGDSKSPQEYDVVNEVIVPHNDRMPGPKDTNQDPLALWTSQPMMGWADAVEDSTTFIPYYNNTSGKVYLLKEGSTIPRGQLPPELFSGLSNVPQWIKIVDIRLAPRSERIEHNQFSGELVNMRLVLEESQEPSTE